MATAKITIILPNEQLEEMSVLVAAGRTASISAFTKHAVAVGLSDAAEWSKMLDDALRQTGGPLTEKERAWAGAILSPKKRQRNGRAA